MINVSLENIQEIEWIVGTKNIITNAEEHRAFLLGMMTRVADGSTSVAQANAVIGLSSEVHKSIRQQWDIAVYAADNLRFGEGNKALRRPENGDDNQR